MRTTKCTSATGQRLITCVRPDQVEGSGVRGKARDIVEGMPGDMTQQSEVPKPNKPASSQQRVPDQASSQMQACLAEYTAMRAHIEGLIHDSSQYQNFAVALVAGLGTVLVLGDDGAAFKLGLSLLAPLPFSILGLLYLRIKEEIAAIAGYIHEELRPLVVELTGENRIWRWETYRSSRLGTASEGVTMETSRAILLLRLALFLVPSLVAIGGAILIVLSSALSDEMRAAGAVLTLFDAIVIGVLVIRVWKLRLRV